MPGNRLKRMLRALAPYAALVAALFFVTGTYFFSGVPHEYLTGEYKGTFEGDYDFTLELAGAASRWGSLPLWSETFSGPIPVFASNFHVYAQALLWPLTGSLPLSIKLLQALQLLVAGAGMYWLALRLFRERIPALFSAALYMFTPFYIGHLLSYLHYTGVYMLAPAVFLLILRAVEDESWPHLLALAPVMAYSVLSHPQNVFIGGLFYAAFYAAIFVRKALVGLDEGRLCACLRATLPMTAALIALVALLSSFIALPTLIDGYPYLRTSWVSGAEGLVRVDTGHIASHSQSVLSALSSQHWPWSHTPIKGGEYPDWRYMPFFLLPFAMAAVAVVLRPESTTFILVALAALSVQLSLGVNGWPNLFSFASRHIPMFGMSRTPYTYINIAILSFCLLSAVTFSRLLEWATRVLSRPSAALAALSVLVIPYLVSAAYYGGEYNWTFIPAKEPEYLGKVRGWMDGNNQGRLRVIETCGIPTAMLLGHRMLPNQVELLERHLDKPYLADYLALLGFGHVVAPALPSQRDKTFDRKGYSIPTAYDGDAGMEEYYSALTTDYSHVYGRLKSDPAFRLHSAGTKDVAIFENTRAFAGYELYPARSVMVLGGTDSYDLLSLERYRTGGLRPAPVFIAQSENLARIDEISTVSDGLVLHNTDNLDMYLLLRKGNLSLVRPRPADKMDWEMAIESNGIQQPFPQQDHSVGASYGGELVFGGHALKAMSRGSSLEGGFSTGDGVYRVLARVWGSADASSLLVSVDGGPGRTVFPSGHAGFRWMPVWEGRLEKGNHSISMTLEKDSPAVVDSLAVDRALSLDAGAALALDGLNGAPVTYIINARKFVMSEGRATTAIRTGQLRGYSPTLLLSKGAKPDAGGMVSLYIDGRKAGEVGFERLGEYPGEYSMPPISLSAGEHLIEVRGLSDKVALWALSLMGPVEAPPAAASVAFRRTGPSSYSFVSDSDRPFMLVFSETNYPGWSMSSGKALSRPVVTNMFMNGFIVPGGRSSGEIAYSNRAQKAGLWLSGSAAAAIAVALPLLALRARRRGP